MSIQKFAQRFQLAAVTVAALTAFVGTARADDITPDPYTHMVSTRPRAEVLAELHAARADGSMAQVHAEDSGSFRLARQAFASTRTRAQVQAEVLEARRAGTTDALSGEDSGSFHFARLLRSAPVADGPRLAAVTR